MKSSMTFILGNRWIEREKYVLKNGRKVKRLKDCALALSEIIVHFQVPGLRPFKTLILHARLRT